MYSDAVEGGARVRFMLAPTIHMGTVNSSPLSLFVESDTISNKFWYAPSLSIINPNAVTAALVVSPGAATTMTKDPQITVIST